MWGFLEVVALTVLITAFLEILGTIESRESRFFLEEKSTVPGHVQCMNRQAMLHNAAQNADGPARWVGQERHIRNQAAHPVQSFLE
jgi:hypothetical protein